MASTFPSVATIAVALFASLLPGCRALGTEPLPPEGDLAVAITTDRTDYDPGATVQVHFSNATSETLGYSNLCGAPLEYKRGGVWREIPRTPPPCAAILLLLSPFASRDLPYALPSDLASGLYRIRYEFSREQAPGGTGLTRRSNTFIVTR